MSLAGHLHDAMASSPSQTRYRHLDEILPTRAADSPDREAFRFLLDGKVEGGELITYAALDLRARRLAAELVKRAPDERACLLLLPPGIDFVCAVFACIYANKTIVALPYLSDRITPHLQRELHSVIATARSRLVVANHVTRGFAADVGLAGRAWVDAADDPSRAALSRPVASDPSAMAFMQFTSGSTSTPKGVMVSHHAAVHNLGSLGPLAGYGADSRSVMWSPHYHTMGLILGILVPSYYGCPGALMSPLDFARNPACWLEAIAALRGTITWAPNSAYELCIRQPPDKVDLRSLRVAGNGAEPISPSTLERFAARFAESGFDARACSPAYGLSENTLIATGSPVGRGPIYLDVARAKLNPRDVGGAERLVGSGRAVEGTDVCIVDPERRELVGDGVAGEIWLRGTSTARGYWEAEELTREVFGATLSSGGGSWLRTGDLGLMLDGELFVSGRRKESIIRNGVKYAPAEIEQAAELYASVRGLRSAAFAVTRPGGADLIVLLVELGQRVVDPEAELARLAEIVFRECGLQLDHALFVHPGTIQETATGKRMRLDCRRRYLDGEIEALHSYRPRGTRR